MPVDRIFVKRRRRLGVDEQYGRASAEAVKVLVRESGLRFSENLSEYLDTGLFLDHRLMRGMLRAGADGKSVLNLFCYTGSFSVYALAGGASRVVSVDLSNTYLAWAEENVRINGLDASRHEPVRADVQAYLAGAAARAERFDRIVLDPPTFSNSKKMDGFLDINRHWPELVGACAGLLAPGGELYFSTNSRSLKFDPALLPGLVARDISGLTVSEDFRGKPHRAWLISRA